MLLHAAMYSTYACLSRQQFALQFIPCRLVRAAWLAASSSGALVVDTGARALGMEAALACARTVRTAVLKRMNLMLLVA